MNSIYFENKKIFHPKSLNQPASQPATYSLATDIMTEQCKLHFSIMMHGVPSYERGLAHFTRSQITVGNLTVTLH